VNLARLEGNISRLAIPVSVVGSICTVLLVANALGPVVGLSVAAVLAELTGLALVAEWLEIDLGGILTGRVFVKAGGASARGRVGTPRLKITPEPLERAVERLEGEIDQLRDLAETGDRSLGRRIDALEGSLPAQIRQESRDPALGVVLIVIGTIVSACANIVGA
jgi:hypothetical protein